MGYDVANLLAALAPPSLHTHVVDRHGSCCGRCASLPSDSVVRRVLLTCQVITMRWAGDVASQSLCRGWCRRCVPWWSWVIERRLWEVGGGGDAKLMEDVEMVTVCLFLTKRHSRGFSIKRAWCELLSNINAEFVSHQFRCVFMYRQALDPHLQHGPRKLGRASSAGHSLPGARPLDPLVHMFNLSSCTHA